MAMFNHTLRPKQQQGVALIVVLVMLLIITLVGVSAMQSTTLQERMAGNLRDQTLAFNMSEAALRDAEVYLQQNSIGKFDGSSTGLFYSSANNVPDWSNASTTSWVVRSGTVSEVVQQPDYIIEELPPVYDTTQSASADTPLQEPPIYRITARGYGSTDGSSTVLQTTFRR